MLTNEELKKKIVEIVKDVLKQATAKQARSLMSLWNA